MKILDESLRQRVITMELTAEEVNTIFVVLGKSTDREVEDDCKIHHIKGVYGDEGMELYRGFKKASDYEEGYV